METDIGFAPISAQSEHQLRKKAVELRRMASTATTEDVKHALLRLAERYDTIARRREE